MPTSQLTAPDDDTFVDGFVFTSYQASYMDPKIVRRLHRRSCGRIATSLTTSPASRAHLLFLTEAASCCEAAVEEWKKDDRKAERQRAIRVLSAATGVDEATALAGLKSLQEHGFRLT